MEDRMGILAGRRVLITGGASGIGRATTALFAREGASISVVDVDESGGQTIVQSIVEKGGQAVFIRCDVSLAIECQNAVQRSIDELGGIDVLINSAGIIRRATVVETTEAEWDRVMNVNVKSVYLLAKYAVPALIQAGGGVIINISSGWGLVGGYKAAVYCASKGAVIQLTKAMALDHGAQGIRVNCICPGDTDTPMLREEARQLGEPEDQFLADAAHRPLGRIGKPDDIAQAALYLASDAASFITGATLVVDGGGIIG
jgi:NAD(P)-dependent dehydrogenase (short-subunit alcohol dehydrogenase family)